MLIVAIRLRSASISWSMYIYCSFDNDRHGFRRCKTPSWDRMFFSIGQDIVYIDCKHNSFQVLASMFYLNRHKKRRDVYVALMDMVCFIFQNDVEFTALAEEKATLIRLREV